MANAKPVAAMSTPLYPASRIRRRHSATMLEVESRRDALFAIVELMHPMTARQTFYQATVRGLVEKSEAGFDKVQSDLVQMRRSGALPYDWLADNTRWEHKPRSFGSIQEALDDTAQSYRKALWREANAYVEVWLEKGALAGVVYPVTSLYDVSLMVTRECASRLFLLSSAEYFNSLEVPAFIYYLGDFDSSDVIAGEKIEDTLRELAPEAELIFERIAVTPRQIKDWLLPTRPTKTSDSGPRNFGKISVELDAIEPDHLRRLVEQAINRHLPQEKLRVLQLAEENERELLQMWASREP